MAKSLALRFVLLAALIPLAACRITESRKAAALRAVTAAILGVTYDDATVSPLPAEPATTNAAAVAAAPPAKTNAAAPRAGKTCEIRVAMNANDAKTADGLLPHLVEPRLSSGQARVVTGVRIRTDELQVKVEPVRAALAAVPRPLARI
ncbi:MAG TPA: hypothetical protein VNL91_01425 [Thermoanaerobaculia bacterium]|nr:hypothetical protein [Thermoanaerobaculia bacterium]